MNGTIITWRSPSTVTQDQIRRALAAVGLNEAMARDLNARNAIARALRDMREGRVITRYRRDSDDARLVRFQLTTEAVSSTGASYLREADVLLDTTTGVMMSDSAQVEDRARELIAHHIATRGAADVTRLMQHIIDTAGSDLVPIRDAGGVYFVPAARAELLAQLDGFMAAIGGKLSSFAVAQDARTDASVAESVADYIATLVAEWRDSIAGISADSKEFLVARRSNRLAELRAKIGAYRDILGAAVDRLEIAVAAGDAALLAAIAGSPIEEGRCQML